MQYDNNYYNGNIDQFQEPEPQAQPIAQTGDITVAWTENRTLDYQKREVTVTVTVPVGTDIGLVIRDLKRQVKTELDACIPEMRAISQQAQATPQQSQAKSYGGGGYKKTNSYGGGNNRGYSNGGYNGARRTAPQAPDYSNDYRDPSQMSIDELLSLQVPEGFFGKGANHHPPMGYNQFGYTLRACSNKELNYIGHSNNASGTLLGKAACLLASQNYGFQG